jgi:TPR repeat protein
VEQDLARALAWLEIAAALGYERAVQTLGSLRDQLPEQTVSDAKRLARDLAADSQRSPDGA